MCLRSVRWTLSLPSARHCIASDIAMSLSRQTVMTLHRRSLPGGPVFQFSRRRCACRIDTEDTDTDTDTDTTHRDSNFGPVGGLNGPSWVFVVAAVETLSLLCELGHRRFTVTYLCANHPNYPYYHHPWAPATFVPCSLTYSGLSQLAPMTSSSVYIFERQLAA